MAWWGRRVLPTEEDIAKDCGSKFARAAPWICRAVALEAQPAAAAAAAASTSTEALGSQMTNPPVVSVISAILSRRSSAEAVAVSSLPRVLRQADIWAMVVEFCDQATLRSVSLTHSRLLQVLLDSTKAFALVFNPWRNLVDIFDEGVVEEMDGPPSSHGAFADVRLSRRTRTSVYVDSFPLCFNDWTLCFRYRVNSIDNRQILFGDWDSYWKILVLVEPQGPVAFLRRNLYGRADSADSDEQRYNCGSRGEQGLVSTILPPSREPCIAPGEWHTCAFTWSRRERLLRTYHDGQLIDASRPTDGEDVNLQLNGHAHFAIGAKTDGPETLNGVVARMSAFAQVLPAAAIAMWHAEGESLAWSELPWKASDE